MNCRECTPMLSAHRDGRLDATQRSEIDAHMATCASCARAARMMRATGEVMAARGPAEPAPDFAARVARMAMTAEPSDQGASLWRWWMRVATPAMAVGATAALILVLMGGTPRAQPGEAAGDVDPIGLVSDGSGADLDATMLALGDE